MRLYRARRRLRRARARPVAGAERGPVEKGGGRGRRAMHEGGVGACEWPATRCAALICDHL
eukprot:3021730-Pleurochrysis_carterae.AAC.1